MTVLDEIVVRAKAGCGEDSLKLLEAGSLPHETGQESLDSEVITVLREATREEKPPQDRSLRKYMRTRLAF